MNIKGADEGPEISAVVRDIGGDLFLNRAGQWACALLVGPTRQKSRLSNFKQTKRQLFCYALFLIRADLLGDDN